MKQMHFFKGNLKEGQADNLRKSLKQVWSGIFCPIDVNSDGSVSEEELITYVKQVL